MKKKHFSYKLSGFLLVSLLILNSGLQAQWVVVPSPIHGSGYGFFLSGGEIISTNSAIGACHSSDGGTTWVAYPGLPNEQGLGSIGIAKSGNILFNSIEDFLLRLPDSAGVFRSTDDGDSWKVQSVPDLNFNVFTDLGRYFFARSNSNGLWRSSDSGATWQRPSDSTRDARLRKQSVVALYPIGNSLFAVTLSAGVFVSKDFGDDWAPFRSGLPLDYIWAAASQGNYQYVAFWDEDGPGSSVYRSGPGDTSWSLVLQDSTEGPYNISMIASKNFVFMLGKQHDLFGSSDYGTTWSRLSDFPKTTQDPIYLVATDNDLLVAADSLYRRPLTDLGVAAPTKLPKATLLAVTADGSLMTARFFMDRERSAMDLTIFDLLGRPIESHRLGSTQSGWNTINYHLDHPTGSYFCRLVGESYSQGASFLLIR